MSNLQKIIQEAANESRRTSGRSSPRTASQTASRSQSRTRGPAQNHHDSDNEDYTASGFLSPKLNADALAENLSALLLDDGTKKTSTAKDKYTEAVEVLATDRRNSSLAARERALVAVLSVIAQKYEPEKLPADVIESLVKSYLSSRSDLESILALQAVAIAATVDIDTTADLIQDTLLPQLWKACNDVEHTSGSIRGNYVLCYALLQYVMHFGGGGFGIDELVESLVGFATAGDDDDAAARSAAVLGAGLLSMVPPNPNAIIDDQLSFMVDLLGETQSQDIKLSVGKVVALWYQLYQYPDDEDEEEEQALPLLMDRDEVVRTLREAVSESAKRIGRKDKRERKSLYRDVLSTVETFASRDSRDAVSPSDLVITHMSLSTSKSLPVDSWAKLLLVQHYRWLFGPGLHTQVANNPFIKESLAAASYTPPGAAKYRDAVAASIEPDPAVYTKADARTHHAVSESERTRHRRAERFEKRLDQGLVNAKPDV